MSWVRLVRTLFAQELLDEVGLIAFGPDDGCPMATIVEVRAQVSPNDVSCGGDLEELSLVRGGDEGVPVGKPLIGAPARRVEVSRIGCLVLPDDLLRDGIHFDDPRPAPAQAVVEDENVSVVEE